MTGEGNGGWEGGGGREFGGSEVGMGGDPLWDGVKEGNRGVKHVW